MPLNAVIENQPYLRNGEACKSPDAEGRGHIYRPYTACLVMIWG